MPVSSPTSYMPGKPRPLPAVETSRVVFLRTSLVLDKRGGLLKLMLVPFKLGAGAKLGRGTQYMSFISLGDWLRAVEFLLESPTANGPYNLAMPQSQTNAEFTELWARHCTVRRSSPRPARAQGCAGPRHR